jgi:hypothetical protein
VTLLSPFPREGEKVDTIRLREFAFAFLKIKSKFLRRGGDRGPGTLAMIYGHCRTP